VFRSTHKHTQKANVKSHECNILNFLLFKKRLCKFLLPFLCVLLVKCLIITIIIIISDIARATRYLINNRNELNHETAKKLLRWENNPNKKPTKTTRKRKNPATTNKNNRRNLTTHDQT
jgi:predicted PurR-regulated permease PerM